jgi:quercetin dioxygenase-like cupin family protein
MSATRIDIGELSIDYLIDGSQNAGMGIFELTVGPGSTTPPPHSHRDNEEIVYVLSGTLRYTVFAVKRDLTSVHTLLTPKCMVLGF